MLTLYGHPFSMFSWKAEIALIEAGLPYSLSVIEPDAPEVTAAWLRLWPMAKMPVLDDGGTVVAETSIIIEHLAHRFPTAARLIPPGPAEALEARYLDRVFDLPVAQVMQQPVAEKLRGGGRDDRLDEALATAAAKLSAAYGWLEGRIAGREWAAGGAFSLADCAAGPALFYADWVHPIPAECPAVRAYRARLLSRPSIARVVEAARPYRGYFPLGAPDRD